MSNNFTKILKKPILSNITIGFIFISVIITVLYYKDWRTPYKVFGSDGISYYSYLPIVFIYKDLEMTFYEKNDLNLRSQFHHYPKKTPTGNWVMPTSMGLAFLILPFFLFGHTVALLSSFEVSGFSMPYQILMHIGTLFYFLAGLHFLRKLLLRFFNDWNVSFTLITVALGTNLFYYVTSDPMMSHTFSFALITLFLLQVINWYKNPNYINTSFIGVLLGLITLLRPTNVIILLFFILWDVKSIKELGNRIVFLANKFHLILIMIISFSIIWIPQFLYWKYVAGSYIYWSYRDSASFFFSNSQVLNVLFSFRKGWLIYTPVMTIALVGIPFLWKKLKSAFYPVLITTILAIYVISSWWSWWYGASFGQRPFIDFYSLLAIPLGAFYQFVEEKSVRLRYIIVPVVTFLIFLNLFQCWQVRNNLIHQIGMTRSAYFMNFLKTKPHPNFRDSIIVPNYSDAKKGIYYSDKEITEGERKRNLHNKLKNKQDSINYYKHQIINNIHFYNYIREKARKRDMTIEKMIELDAQWLYEQKKKKNNR